MNIPLVVRASTLGGIIGDTLPGHIPALDWLHPGRLTDAWADIPLWAHGGTRAADVLEAVY